MSLRAGRWTVTIVLPSLEPAVGTVADPDLAVVDVARELLAASYSRALFTKRGR